MWLDWLSLREHSASGLKVRNRGLQPVFDLLESRPRIGNVFDCLTLWIERDVVTRNIFRAALGRDELVQRALVACVRTKRIAVIQAGQ